MTVPLGLARCEVRCCRVRPEVIIDQVLADKPLQLRFPNYLENPAHVVDYRRCNCHPLRIGDMS